MHVEYGRFSKGGAFNRGVKSRVMSNKFPAYLDHRRSSASLQSRHSLHSESGL